MCFQNDDAHVGVDCINPQADAIRPYRVPVNYLHIVCLLKNLNAILFEKGANHEMSQHVSSKATSKAGIPMPIAGALLVGTLSALIVGFSFVVIKYWPLPASVAPYGGFPDGLIWGAVVGSITGFAIGFLVDEKHFDR